MDKKICLYGDSVAEGIIYDSCKNKFVKSNYSFIKKFCSENNYELEDNSRFGCTLRKAIPAIRKDIETLKKYTAVVLMFGGNDCNFDWMEVAKHPAVHHQSTTLPDDFYNEYLLLINDLTRRNIKVILLNMIPVVGKTYFRFIGNLYGIKGIKEFLLGPETIEHYNEMFNCLIYKVARAADVSLIDIRSCLLSKKNLQEYYCSDGIHPNMLGYETLYQATKDQLKKALK